MAKKLLIDASHPEEIRVAVLHQNSLEEFDSETSSRKHVKSNIYLAKIVRVEPSLQAAFVDYGEERHGFLPFSEIHPDYYRIPVSDRVQLERYYQESESIPADDDTDEGESEEAGAAEAEDDNRPKMTKKLMHRYKIQEVIKSRQILLIQVVKEERGNKGAALTTYLSLPGRYCVLMPNAGFRAGGVSRRIGDSRDRTRLKDIVKGLEVPETMALIVRTAGQERNKLEIKRDYDYLLRLWSEIRDKTMTSIAPCLVYEEGDLVKKAIRDVYSRDVSEIQVSGEQAYKDAKSFMKMLMPSHVKKITQYKDEKIPLFHKYDVEKQINAVLNPVVQLPSGGYLVISVTEALVAIDVNSGRATRERNVETTALKTNLEAAEEVARQMRLRDLAGLIVIDFIDMREQSYNQQVEKKLKESAQTDRARIQFGRISQFGLMELSRQRLRPSIVETYASTCTHCHGTGLIHSTDSTALQVLRAIEAAVIKDKPTELLVTVPNGVDLYLLNQKRAAIVGIEQRYGLSVQIMRDSAMIAPDYKLTVTGVSESSGSVESVAPTSDAALPERRQPQKKRPHQPKQAPRQRMNQESPAEIKEEKPQEKNVEQSTSSEEDAGSAQKFDKKKSNQHRRRQRQRFNRDNRQQRQQEGASGETLSAASSETVSKPKTEKKVAEEPEPAKKGWLRRLLD